MSKNLAKCESEGCGQVIGLRPDDNGRLLCAYHDPERIKKREERERRQNAKVMGLVAQPDELPIAKMVTLEDALQLARWIPVAVAIGRVGRGEAQAMIAAIKEFRQVIAEVETVKRLEELEKRIAAAKARGIDV